MELTPGLIAGTERVGSGSETLERMCADLAGLEESLSPMSRDLDAVRAAFSATNDELERLRHALTLQLSGVRANTGALQDAIAALREPTRTFPMPCASCRT